MTVARAFQAPSLQDPEAAQCQGDGMRPAELRPLEAVLRRLRVDEAEVTPLSPAIDFPSQGATRARARGLVWPGDTGYNGRTTLLPATHRRPLPLHVGCGPWQQGRGSERHQAHAGCCGGRVRPQTMRAAHQQRW
jgi:hypothetical protein